MIAERADSRGPVDWWPFTRIIVTAVALGLAAHVFLGWQVRPRALFALSGQILGVLSILAMISFVLADLYLLVFLIPLYAVGVLNDWFYSAGFWACRLLLRSRSARLAACGGLCIEVLLFGGLAYALSSILR